MSKITNELGTLAQGIANRLSRQDYLFVLGAIAVAGSTLAFVSSNGDPLPTVLVAGLSLMAMLFSLLAERNRPHGWNPFWTFLLMLSFVFVALVVLAYLFFIFRYAPDDPSHALDNSWRNNHEVALGSLDRELDEVFLTAGIIDKDGALVDEHKEHPGSLFSAISSYIDAKTERGTTVLQGLGALEEFEGCRQTNCRTPEVITKFEGRIFDFWANYRCYIDKMRRRPGYDGKMGVLVQRRYEGSDRVTDRLRRVGLNSLRDCPQSAVENEPENSQSSASPS